jgi:phosphomannomutase/phosphoglucomutase
VLDVGVVPTPLIYFAANTLPVDGPRDDHRQPQPARVQRFKIGAGKTTFHGHDIQALRKLIEASDFETSDEAGPVEPYDIITPYNHFIRQTVKVGRKGMRIVDRRGNGTGGAVACRCSSPWASTWCPCSARWTPPSPTTTRTPTVVENLRGSHRAR